MYTYRYYSANLCIVAECTHNFQTDTHTHTRTPTHFMCPHSVSTLHGRVVGVSHRRTASPSNTLTTNTTARLIHKLDAPFSWLPRWMAAGSSPADDNDDDDGEIQNWFHERALHRHSAVQLAELNAQQQCGRLKSTYRSGRARWPFADWHATAGRCTCPNRRCAPAGWANTRWWSHPFRWLPRRRRAPNRSWFPANGCVVSQMLNYDRRSARSAFRSDCAHFSEFENQPGESEHRFICIKIRCLVTNSVNMRLQHNW